MLNYFRLNRLHSVHQMRHPPVATDVALSVVCVSVCLTRLSVCW